MPFSFVLRFSRKKAPFIQRVFFLIYSFLLLTVSGIFFVFLYGEKKYNTMETSNLQKYV